MSSGKSKIYTSQQVLSSPTLFNHIIALLDSSFSSDPIPNWLFKDSNPTQFVATLTHYHRFLLRRALHASAICIAVKDDNFDKSKHATSPFRALTVLVPPSGSKAWESLLTILSSGIYSLMWNAGFKSMRKLVVELAPAVQKMAEGSYPAGQQHKRFENWHLFFLATRPDCQGQGLGGRLIRECQELVRVEERKRMSSGNGENERDVVAQMYLESSTSGSRRLYEGCGFVEKGSMVYGDVKKGETVSKDVEGKILGGTLWAMIWTQ